MKKVLDYFYQTENHLILSTLASAFGLVVVTIIFIIANYSNNANIIAEFSIFFVIFFSISLLSLLGNDQEVIAKSKNINNHKNIIYIDQKIYKIFYGILLSTIIFFIVSKNIKYLEVDINSFQILILYIAVNISLFCKNIQSYLQASSKLFENAFLDFSRQFGYFIFMAFWIYKKIDIAYFFLFGELVVFFSILYLYFCERVKVIYEKSDKTFDNRYLIIGVSQFAYQSIFKLDVLVIGILGNTKMLIFYAILSNVIEGILNFLTTYHPFCNNLIVKLKNNKIINKDIQSLKNIKKVSSFLILLILPSYLLLNFLVFHEIPIDELLLVCFLLMIAAISFKKLFLFFYFFSMTQRPFLQLIFSISFMLTNLILNVILFKIYGVMGIGLATFVTYSLFYFIHTFFSKSYIDQL